MVITLISITGVIHYDEYLGGGWWTVKRKLDTFSVLILILYFNL